MAIEIELKASEIIQRTYNVKSFRFRPDKKIGFKPGQFLQATIIVDGKPESKYLSISSSPTEDFIEFTKKLTGSPFSSALDNMRKGDIAKLRLPMGNFNLDENNNKIAFLSGGIGITPIRSMLKYATDMRLAFDIILLYSNRTVKDIAFKEDLQEMQKINKSLKVVYLITEPGAETCDDNVKPGCIDKGTIIKEVPDYRDRLFYTCGPPAMVEAMKNIVTDGLGLGPERIKFENFAGY